MQDKTWWNLLSTDDGPQYGSYENARAKDAQSVAASDRIPNVGDDSAYVY
jgi:hypothetical protein